MVLRSMIAAALLLAVPWMTARAEAQAAADGPACVTAGRAAEARYGVPAGLLLAVGVVESGRRGPDGTVAAWPWAINAEGRGRLFEGRDETLAAVRALQESGVQSIDVGCFQVNLMHHRTAFATLEEGLDPARNADYAARLLVALRERTGSWETAVAHYHSAVPERGGPYRDKVLAAWGGGGLPSGPSSGPPPGPSPGPSLGAPPRGVMVPMVIRMVAWSPPRGAAGGMRIWTPSGVGQGAAVIALR